MKILQCPLQGASDQPHLTKVFKAAYDVLYTYMVGSSRKNALYFAKYIPFFQSQIIVTIVSACFLFIESFKFPNVLIDGTIQGDIGLNVAQMLVELIRDNRKIVDRISLQQIEMFVGLLKLNKVSSNFFFVLII